MLAITSISLDFQHLTDDPRTHHCATGRPVISWCLEGATLPDAQLSYRLVFTCKGAQFIYDTGRVASADQRYTYDGPELPAGQRIAVSLEVESEKNGRAKAGDYFLVAALDTWRAPWIAAGISLPTDRPRYFRRVFRVSGKLRSATLYVCGLGYQFVLLNGMSLLENRFLDPAVTDYSKRCNYVMFPDLQEVLKKGDNCLGVEVGLGWRDNFCIATDNGNVVGVPFRGDPCLTACLHLVYERGGEEWLLTDEDWECGAGPIVSADIFNGCTYDARLANPAWCTCDFEGFAPAKLHPGPGGRLEPMVLSPVDESAVMEPVATWQRNGKWIYDFGRNIAGTVVVPLPRGLR